MRSGWVLCIAAVTGLVSPAGSTMAAGEEIRVIWSFEKDETAKSLPEFGYWGMPAPIGTPEPGWRGTPPEPGYKGDITAVRKASSRDYPLMTLTAQNVTDGDYSYRFEISERMARGIAAWVAKPTGGTACPPAQDYHNLVEWYWQRTPFGTYLWRHGPANRDWTGFDRLRFDVLSTKAPVVLGVKVRDLTATDGRPKAHPHGVRTRTLTFHVPAGKQVTCDVLLAEVARVCELDLTRIHRYHIRLNGVAAATDLYLDHVRLVTAAAAAKDARLPLVAMDGKPEPWAREVVFSGHTVRAEATLKRSTGPVDTLGPVTVVNAPGQYASAPGHFGGSGTTYFQSTRRSCVAYDNDRLLVVIGGGPKEARLVTPSVGEGGGVYAFASFDGGKTWGGPKPGDATPARFGNWYWRGNLASDRNGDVYWVGTQNCDSYHEGYDVLFRRLAFTGEGWTADRVACMDQNGYKCPAWASAVRTDSGRLWAAWRDGFGGSYAKYSDDDGLTWSPCKDAAQAAPRPFYQPSLTELQKAPADRPAPPQQVLLWPSEPVCGEFLLPWRGQVAVISATGDKWQTHDGARWGVVQPGPFKGPGLASCALLGSDRLCVSRAGGGTLFVAQLVEGAWRADTLDSGEFVSDILTVSGDAVFCFYIKNNGEKYEVMYRRFAAGKWAPAVTIATEDVALNQIAAPVFCPPAYAAVFWDQKRPDSRASTFVKFMRVANK
ncbi:MAG: hypothetical protein AMS14_09645 [Planctomycetes bacterium DG_20]|nr:MAG: hypothetical protein AMS14_09645 [Planctomycetes bacterium DG_20]